jgi:hypothetical protein
MDCAACRLSGLELRERGSDRGLRNGKSNSGGGNTHICCSLTSVGALSKEKNKERLVDIRVSCCDEEREKICGEKWYIYTW